MLEVVTEMIEELQDLKQQLKLMLIVLMSLLWTEVEIITQGAQGPLFFYAFTNIQIRS